MWDCHIARFTILKCGNGPVGDSRIKYVTDHLDVLDRKFGVLLQFQALLATSGSVIVTGLYKATLGQGDYSDGAKYLLEVMCVLWVVDTLLCLAGIRRLVWGDMGPFDAKASANSTAEAVQVGAFRAEIIKRTAKFRIAVAILLIMVTMLPAMICVAINRTFDFLATEVLLAGLVAALILISRQHRERAFNPYDSAADCGPEKADEASSITYLDRK
jgi:hypothetical protein